MAKIPLSPSAPRALAPAYVGGHDGVRLAVRVAGESGAVPIVFIHGYSLGGIVWERQLGSALADRYLLVAPDLRGHGDSDAPETGYEDPEVWAADMHAVLDHQALDRPILVAWSYGGLVLGDFLARGGASRVGGVVLVAAALSLGPLPPPRSGDPFFDLIPGFVSDDPSIGHATAETFVDLLTAEPLDASTRAGLLATVERVRPDVRRGLIERVVDNVTVFQDLKVPALVIHGADDTLLPPVVSTMNAQAVGGVDVSTFEGCGHSPFIEDPDRFNAELSEFVLQASGWATQQQGR